MSFLRPEAAAALRRWREVILAALVVMLGAWVFAQGGWILAAAGLLIAALGAALGLLAIRRLRFARAVADPGIVQVLEGQITYFGPAEGGFAGLSALSEIALLTRGGTRCWRLSQPGEAPLFIPTAAAGAEILFDAFAGLPGLDSAALLDAIEGPVDLPRIVWRRRQERRLR